MSRDEIYKQIKTALQKAYKDRLKGIVLYGSEARQEATEDSDIDILVLLSGNIQYGRDLNTNIEVLYPLALQIDRRISAKPVNVDEYNTIDCPLYRNAHREGIQL